MCDSTYMRFIVEFIETESGMAAVRGWGEGRNGVSVHRVGSVRLGRWSSGDAWR